MNYKHKFSEYKAKFENYLKEYFDNLNGIDKPLYDAIKYSMFAEGKRIRPVLLLAVCDELKGNVEKALPFALALECMHTSSLIHDDMPEMDNDDLRRGVPTCHKRFGQSTALLAGDALINLSYKICLDAIKDDNDVKAIKILADASGAQGMLSGQSADKRFEKVDDYSYDDLDYIYQNKTCKLLTAALCMASALCGGEYMEELTEIGNALGKIFQATDDLLDVLGSTSKLGKTVGKDGVCGKLTLMRFYDVTTVKYYIEDQKNTIENILNLSIKSEFLKEFMYDIISRTK